MMLPPIAHDMFGTEVSSGDKVLIITFGGIDSVKKGIFKRTIPETQRHEILVARRHRTYNPKWQPANEYAVAADQPYWAVDENGDPVYVRALHKLLIPQNSQLTRMLKMDWPHDDATRDLLI